MNKKYVAYSLLMGFLAFSSVSFSMHRALFMGAKAIGVGTLPAYGLYKSHSKYSEYKHFHAEIEKTSNISQALPKRLLPIFYENGIEKPIDPVVEEFIRKRLIELKVPNADSLAIGTFYCDELMTMYDSLLLIGEPFAQDLEMALKTEEVCPLLSKNRENDTINNLIRNLQETREDQVKLNDAYNAGEIPSEIFERLHKKLALIEKGFEGILEIEQEKIKSIETEAKSINDIIDETNAFVSHEAGHLISKDHLRDIYASALIPTAVQAGWSAIGSGIKKMFPTYGPLTLKQVALRSFGNVGSIVPKLALTFVGTQFYWTGREMAADDFGYKNASSKRQLERMRDIHAEGIPYFDEAFHLSPKKEMTQADKLLRYSIAALITGHPDPLTRATEAQKHIDE